MNLTFDSNRAIVMTLERQETTIKRFFLFFYLKKLLCILPSAILFFIENAFFGFLDYAMTSQCGVLRS